MAETPARSIRLDFAGGRPAVTALAEINETLHPIGFGAWPLDAGPARPDIQDLLTRPALTDAERASALDYVLLSRDRLVEIIEGAGRQPQVAGGGEMSTFDTTNSVTYPQLYIVEAGADYTRFDTFHVNATTDGAGLDEVMQILCGGGIRVLQHLADESVFTVTLDCGPGGQGWIVTYDGGRPHIGSFTGAQPGTKIVVQAIGPPRWGVRYVDD
jgi:hypothetical protein